MIPTGYFGQELKVGDRIIFMAKSGSHYLKDCTIHSIGEEVTTDWVYDSISKQSKRIPHTICVVKVSSNGKKYNYKAKKYEDYEYIKRIWNWETALTIENDKVII